MPVGNVLVGDARCHVKHDDAALAVDVVAIAQTTELLLASGVPYIELNLTQVLPHLLVLRLTSSSPNMLPYRCETKWVNLDTEGCDVLLLEFACKMAFHEGSLW